MNDYYQILGVSENATKAEIRKAFRTKAATMHPDKNPGDDKAEQKFKELNEAHQVLSDDVKRSQYDMNRRGGALFDGFPFDVNDLFSQHFNDFFGMGHNVSKHNIRGSDVITSVSLTLEEAIYGCVKDVNYQIKDACSSCNGSGALDGNPNYDGCQNCSGTGIHVKNVGFVTLQSPCSMCGGSGRSLKNPCTNCLGSSLQTVEKVTNINFPSGIDNGSNVVIKQAGSKAPYRSGKNGDLFIKFEVKKHNRFWRKGDDLHTVIKLGFANFVFGDQITLDLLNGKPWNVTVPAGTVPNSQLMLQGLGVKGKGNLIVHLELDMPILSKESSDRLKKCQELWKVEKSNN